MRTVTLHGKKAAGRVTPVDDGDYELATAHSWWVLEYERKGRKAGPYAYTRIRRDDGRFAPLYLHQLITGWPLTDHIDHDGLNNQRSNLRPATRTQNQGNRRSALGSTSKYKGVCWRRNARRWVAQIQADGSSRYLGFFASEEEAAIAYNIAALEVFGPYAYLNQIETGAP